ncbi:PRC-barrel domain-containing protein [Marinicella gelatinilytica]|uniref:PRC-barrel domain-containing protein n=1 Tax=Marinicella gelatinilytica TaxID=2996017 RepID=UPI002260CB0D|nr:PRC-barrel domain-containing protein [Marinicella gelatinilytica]MCX7545321.1 PRC-barrel domain-containing protein [Marinicella gelatinilytica]
MQHTNILSADSLKGNDVKNFEGESLGDIKDFMVDTQTGQVNYAVLDFGGFLGIGNKLFAVPMEAMKLDNENKCFKMDINQEKLKNAEGFDKDHWPNFADAQWQAKNNSYYL